ncbi:MAG: TraB/GumN family protein [Thiohalocapsa sp.]|uniref:TraB/GumN family protein n=1 Tax=Thiohalocapsa sp. TaxID=2497641 RepID=UPI0025D9F37D|nr:TraB/GumN family protein [Thiohalocapsa sp.]MCG6943396.1 TraB/GumN family protein [Thiohalocapsa sp.]
MSVRVNGAEVYLLGTAHVSRASVAQVRALLAPADDGARGFDAVAVELCPGRFESLTDPDRLNRMDLFAVIREQRVYVVAASLALAAYQQRLAEQFGIEPGAEQRAAIELAHERGLPVLLVDRDIGVTLRRAAANLGWWKRLNLFAGLLAGMLSRDEVSEEEIERLKQGDVLETTFAEFAEDRRDLYVPLIKERDQYMAARLRQEIAGGGHRRVLAVLGAGHLAGVADALGAAAGAHADPAATIAALSHVPARSRLWRTLPWLLVTSILGVFVYGFTRSPALGWNLVWDWVVINGGLSALGAVIAAAHPLTVLVSFCAAPLTSLNPTIGAGMVAGAAELMLRRPSVGDFGSLRDDVTTLRGWWRNRVSHILTVFILSSLGSAIGTYVAGFRIIGRLVSG